MYPGVVPRPATSPLSAGVRGLFGPALGHKTLVVVYSATALLRIKSPRGYQGPRGRCKPAVQDESGLSAAPQSVITALGGCPLNSAAGGPSATLQPASPGLCGPGDPGLGLPCSALFGPCGRGPSWASWLPGAALAQLCTGTLPPCSGTDVPNQPIMIRYLLFVICSSFII